MPCEILNYQYSVDWNFENILTNFKQSVPLDPKFPLVISTMSSIGESNYEQAWTEYASGKRRARPSLLSKVSKGSIGTTAGNLLELSGQIVNTDSTCSGSLYALYLASLVSKDQNQPVVVLCCDDMTSNYHLWHFNSFGALDMQTGRPFDNSSKGFKMGRGIAVFLIKHPNVKYTRPVQAYISNFGFYTNPNLIANPGSVQDIITNLSNIDYTDIDLWNAHATGTPVGDQVEYEYFNAVCGDSVAIIGYKGYVGHCMSAAGAIEIAMMLEDRANNQLRPNIILGNKIVADPRIITEPTAFNYRTVLKASLGFGGKTAVAKIKLF